MDALLQLLKRGPINYTWQLPKIGETPSIDWYNPKTIEKIEEELNKAKQEVAWLTQVIDESEKQLDKIKRDAFDE